MATANNRYSFSGADCDAYAMWPGVDVDTNFTKTVKDPIVGEMLKSFTQSKHIHLESLATISISLHEPKDIVRSLGFKGPRGFTRSTRTIAGSMIFTVVEGHPLEEMMVLDPYTQLSYLKNWAKNHYYPRSPYSGESFSLDNPGYGDVNGGSNILIKPATALAPFDLLLFYQTEMNNGKNKGNASMKIEGIEFISEGITTSVNDMVTEVMYQFVAQDYKQFSRLHGMTVKEAISAAQTEAEGRVSEVIKKLQEEAAKIVADVKLNAAPKDSLKIGETGTTVTEEQEPEADNYYDGGGPTRAPIGPQQQGIGKAGRSKLIPYRVNNP